MLNQLQLALSATSGFSINGGPLQFEGTGAGVTLNTPGGTPAGLFVGTATNFAAPTAVTISAPGSLPYDLVLAGRLSGAGSLTFSGDTFANSVIVSSNNTTSGPLTVSAGALSLGGVNALGRTTRVGGTSNGYISTYTPPSAGQGVSSGAFTQAFGNLTGSQSVQIGDATHPAALLVGLDATSPNYTYAGQLLASSGSSHFAKVGPQTMTLTGSSGSFQGTTALRGGSLILQNSGALTGSSMGPLTVQNGSTLRLDNTTTNNNNRIGDSAAITLTTATLRVDGNASADTNEALGALTVGAGQSMIQLVPNAARGTRTTFSAVSGVNGGAVFFTGTGLGSAAFPTANTSVIAFTANPTLVGGGSTGALTSILPWGLGSTTGGTSPDTFVTIGTNGVRPLIASEYATFATAGNTNNVRESANFTVASASTRNSLVTTGGASQTMTMNANLTLTSGAFLNTGAGTQVSGTGTLLFGASGAGTGVVTAQGDLTLAAPGSAAEFVKAGAGTLTVRRPFAVSGGQVTAGAGVLAIQNNGGTTTGAFTSAGGVTYRVVTGATLDVSGVTGGFTLGSSSKLQGAGSVLGSVTVGSGSTLEPTTLPGAGVLSVAGMTWQTGGTYRWQIASALGADDGVTQSKVNGSGTLDLSGLSSANRFTIRPVPLAPDNSAGAVYDFDNTQSYNWPIATFASISGFTPDKFTVDTTEFVPSNPLGGGAFSLLQNGSTVYLVFTPVPEPGTCLVVGAAVLLGVRIIRRRVAKR